MDQTLGRARPEDFPRINELFMEMLRSVYHTDQVQGYAPGDLDRYFAGGEDWICTAEDRGGIVGFLSIEVHREETRSFLYLDDLSVTEAYRGRGIGTALIARAEAFAWESRIPAVELHAERGNMAALRLYGRLGYTVLREEGSRCRLGKVVAQTGTR